MSETGIRSFLKAHLRMPKFFQKNVILCTTLTRLGHFGCHDTDRIISMCALSPKVAKVSRGGVIHRFEIIAGAYQRRKFLGNCWILHEQLIDLKEFFLKLC